MLRWVGHVAHGEINAYKICLKSSYE